MKLKFEKHFKIKLSDRNFTQSFDVVMTILLSDLSNKQQVTMVYRLINHAGCWKNTRRICKLHEPQASDLRILGVSRRWNPIGCSG